jgi:hypothetical protein
MTGAFRNKANPNGVDLGRFGPSRAGMLTDALFSVGFTYGYSRCPASRDAIRSTELTEAGSYLSAYGPAKFDKLCHLGEGASAWGN